jgi:hypothetical protein
MAGGATLGPEAFDLVTGIAAGTVDAEHAACLIGEHAVAR